MGERREVVKDMETDLAGELYEWTEKDLTQVTEEVEVDDLVEETTEETAVKTRTVMMRMKVVKHQSSPGHVPFRMRKVTMFTLMRTYPYTSIMRNMGVILQR